MRFESPGYFGMLAIAVAGVIGLLLAQRTRRRAASTFASSEMQRWLVPTEARRRRLVVGGGLVAVIVLLTLGAARPSRAVDVPFELSSVIVSLDVSRSMAARDVVPNRIDAAKAAARDFVLSLPPNLRVGYVTFSDSASVDMAPTHDREAVISAIERTRLGNGTAIGEGIFSSLDAITIGFGLSTPAAGNEFYERLDGSAVVLLSDGRTNSGRPNRAATVAAARARVPVSTIAFGTPEGKLPSGEAVPVDREALREIAERTTGRYFEATSARQLADVYSNLQSRIGHRTEFRDISIWFVDAAIVLAVLCALLSLYWFARLPVG
jgi:Ca-activated chloride channel family protein